jgi:SAM-dependent methyltransferase
MRIKADWVRYLEQRRASELEMIFSKCPDELFGNGLELGAGSGFQSRLLTRYVCRLTSTDINSASLPREHTESVTYRACDAEEIGATFSSGQFDLVFSSNVLEHLPNPGKALRGVHKILKDDGVTIHVMPSPLWKAFHLTLYVPNHFVSRLEMLTNRPNTLTDARDLSGQRWQRAPANINNNPKTPRAPRSLFRRLLFPEPHGASHRNVEEFYAFSKTRWKKEFEEADLQLISVMKGPLASGYGFGFDRMRDALERSGLTSEYIYIACRKGAQSRYAKYFV